MFSKSFVLALPLAGLAFGAPAPHYNPREILSFSPRAGASSSCVTSYTAKKGDTCTSIAAANSLTVPMFKKINPSLNSDCSNLVAGSQYCISQSSSSSPGSTGTATGSTPKSTGTSPATSSTSSTASSTSQIPDTNTTQVQNATAFASGAGNKNNAKQDDGIGKGSDTYTCYSGTSSNYPDSSKWVSYSDMWTANSPYMLKGCGELSPPVSPETSSEQLTYIKSAIDTVSQASLVDHRFILATIMQESIGCVNTPPTTNGVFNPGLMQSHNGSSFVGSSATPAQQAASIQQMIIDGTQGTPYGGGAVQGINMFGNVYDAAHWYNAGFDDSTSNLNAADGATSAYVVDIANRLTGWVAAPAKTCT